MADRSIVNIVDGPSREQLFDSLRLGTEGRFVTFTLNKFPDGVDLKTPVKLTALVLGISRERIGCDNNDTWWVLVLQDPYTEDCMDARYNTRNRQGVSQLRD